MLAGDHFELSNQSVASQVSRLLCSDHTPTRLKLRDPTDSSGLFLSFFRWKYKPAANGENNWGGGEDLNTDCSTKTFPLVSHHVVSIISSHDMGNLPISLSPSHSRIIG
jgi:hypothetical protein